MTGARWEPAQGETCFYPQWADTDRSALTEESLAQGRDAYKEWAQVRDRP